VGKGILTRQQAYELGAVGPTARGSGVAQDARQTGYHAYGELHFEPVVETDGDCWARNKVRFRETLASIDLIRRAINRMPDGEVRTKIKGVKPPQGETVTRVEQPRGELLYYLKGSGGKTLDRVRIRTPTFANIPPLLVMLPGHFLSDVPVVTLSIDPCISCTER
jgi:ech hydrogenase subunit E